MAVLSIRLFPDPMLRKHSKAVSWDDPRILRLVKDLTETLYKQPGGIGIAAPQVGESQRVIVVDVSPRDPSRRREIMLNPQILKQEGEVLSREGCMSLPDYTANIKRFAHILIQWVDLRGRYHQRWTEGIEAVCLQHEIDHLNGVLFIDRVASLKTDVFPRRRKK